MLGIIIKYVYEIRGDGETLCNSLHYVRNAGNLAVHVQYLAISK